ncbi:MAG: hypothetical protein U5K43_01860 [Halofilum sp. (in: g-proteobacteria)]|nr:hypothetical protein [Halofilum sp. (in: g-proteobacteria)]
MENFRCPVCEQPTIAPRRKWSASSFSPVTCPQCGAAVYPSGRQASLWRIVESLLLTLIVIRALIDFSAWLVVLALLVIAVMEPLRLYLVPLVRLERSGGGFAR